MSADERIAGLFGVGPPGQRWPISRFRETGGLKRWEFVEEFTGGVNDAYNRALQLQQENPDWMYRIWDCR